MRQLVKRLFTCMEAPFFLLLDYNRTKDAKLLFFLIAQHGHILFLTLWMHKHQGGGERYVRLTCVHLFISSFLFYSILFYFGRTSTLMGHQNANLAPGHHLCGSRFLAGYICGGLVENTLHSQK